MVPSGRFAYGGARVHHFRFDDRPMRHSMGRVGDCCRAASGSAPRIDHPAADAAPVLYPDAREPTIPNAESRSVGIAALLRQTAQRCFRRNPRYARHARRSIAASTRSARPLFPRGETVTLAEFARQLGASGADALRSARRSGEIPLPSWCPVIACWPTDGEADRFSINSGTVSQRRLLSLEGALANSGPTLFDALLPLRRRVRIVKSTA